MRDSQRRASAAPGQGRDHTVDEAASRTYFFAGWDGEHSLDDMWVYSIVEGQVAVWHIVPRHEDAVWPGPCSSWFDAGTGCVYLLGCLVLMMMKPNPRVLEAFGASAGEPRPPTQRADIDVNQNRSDIAGNAGIWVLFLLTQILRSAVCYHIRTRTLCPEAMSETEIDSR